MSIESVKLSDGAQDVLRGTKDSYERIVRDLTDQREHLFRDLTKLTQQIDGARKMIRELERPLVVVPIRNPEPPQDMHISRGNSAEHQARPADEDYSNQKRSESWRDGEQR